MTDAIPILAWHTADRFDLVRSVAAIAGLEVAEAGTPERGRGVAELWPGRVRAVDDLRAALASGEAGLALLASPAGFGDDPADAAAAEAFIRRGGRIFSFEPMPPGVRSVAAGWDASVDGTPLWALVGFAGDTLASAAIRAAVEALEQFGPVTALAVSATAEAAAGSLGARLWSAMELVYLIAGEPESINASVAGPRTGREERLAEFEGTLTASIRFGGHRSATVLASAVSGPWHRGITILGPAGRMRIWDDGFAWTGPDGSTVDEHRQGAEATRPSAKRRRKKGEEDESSGLFAVREEHAAPPAARHIASAVSSLLAGQTPRVHASTVLGMAETALLSVRTGSAESPATMRRVAERP